MEMKVLVVVYSRRFPEVFSASPFYAILAACSLYETAIFPRHLTHK